MVCVWSLQALINVVFAVFAGVPPSMQKIMYRGNVKSVFVLSVLVIIKHV